MRVLVVEDESLIAMCLASELHAAGHDVLGPSADTYEVRCLAEQGQVEFALVDLDLGGNGAGIELARTLQNEFQIPVLFLTTRRALALENMDAAMGVITIPFDPADISESIDIATRVMRGRKPPATPHALELF